MSALVVGCTGARPTLDPDHTLPVLDAVDVPGSPERILAPVVSGDRREHGPVGLCVAMLAVIDAHGDNVTGTSLMTAAQALAATAGGFSFEDVVGAGSDDQDFLGRVRVWDQSQNLVSLWAGFGGRSVEPPTVDVQAVLKDLESSCAQVGVRLAAHPEVIPWDDRRAGWLHFCTAVFFWGSPNLIDGLGVPVSLEDCTAGATDVGGWEASYEMARQAFFAVTGGTVCNGDTCWGPDAFPAQRQNLLRSPPPALAASIEAE